MRILNRITVLLIIFFACRFSSFAESTVNINKIINNLVKLESKITSLEVEFSQEILIKAVNEKQVIEGKCFYKSPDKLLFIQKTPITQTISINKKQLVLYNPESNQVLKGDAGNIKELNKLIPGVFNPAGTYKDVIDNYNIKLTSTTAADYVLSGSAKAKDQNIKITIWINVTTYLPDMIEMETPELLNTTFIKQFEVNSITNDNVFDFKPPRDAEVFDFNDAFGKIKNEPGN